jgi:pimeloyl-ACP methyl ester carboxylesterase
MNPQERLRAFRARYPNKMLTAGRAEWRYRICGEGARPLLMLPGGELVNDLGFDLVNALAPRFRIVYPAYPRVDALADLADGIAAILEAENMPRTLALGTSFGGAVAQCLVRRHPDKFERLILSNCGVPLANQVRKRKIANAALSMVPWPVLRRMLARSITKLLGAPAEDGAFWQDYAKELVETRITRADVMSNLRHQLEYHERYRFAPDDLAAWPGKVFIIESDNDLFGPERRKAQRDTYPQAQVYTFRGAGQSPAVSRPGEYREVLERFLG